MANFYALLIGIDYYDPKPDNFDHLQGCVRDIDQIASYLEKSLDLPADNITRLTSPLPNTNSLADVRSARKELPPTYENIVQAFSDITETAQEGDLVYIHYSGHGSRVKTIFPELDGKGGFDEGLVPMDVGNSGHYLRDVEMTTLLKRMTDKGLIVTVIFDSCHSGGATRGDGAVRGSRDGSPDTKVRPTDSKVAPREELVKTWLTLTQGGSKDSWLPNQRDYVFVGACRPTELANEFAFDGKDRNGALTYWMLDTLNASPTALTYQALYERVKGQIHSQFPSQLPMLIGEGDRLVFGSEIKPVRYSLTVVDVKSGQVMLDGGLAQGLNRGARFALYPTGSDFTDLQQRLAVVEVSDVKAATASAKILTAEESGVTPATDRVEAGMSAIIESLPPSLQHPIRLFTKEVGEGENELPSDLATQQVSALDKVRQAMQGNGWLMEAEDDEAGYYQVAVDRNGNYEISIGTPIKNLTPALSINDEGAPAEVVKRLIHLGKYQSAQKLDNPSSRLASSLKFELLDQDGNPFPDPNNIVVTPDSSVRIHIENLSNQSVNIAVLDLDSAWEVYQLPILGQENYAFIELAAGQEIPIEIGGFSFPDKAEYDAAKEIFKLFATRGVANFQWMILPSLDQDLPTRGDLNKALDTPVTRGKDSSEGNINPLNDFLGSIGADLDSPPATRKAKVKADPNADWATKQIQITVKQ